MKRKLTLAGGLLMLALSACTLTMEAPQATVVIEPTQSAPSAVVFDPARCVSDNPGPNVVSVTPVIDGDGACYRLPTGTEVTVSPPPDMPFMPVMVEFYFLGVGLEPDVIGVDHDATDGISILWQTPPSPFQGQLYVIFYSDDKGSVDVNTLGVYGE
ncbi:MAG: hypothetical protein KC547_18230 [Anaerolineae bacterium]|nr:hypothetical protein [Anaerolineae bacterium]